jgi:hypothetical protein
MNDILWIDRRKVKRARRRQRRRRCRTKIRAFTREQIEYACKAAMDYFLKHDPLNSLSFRNELLGSLS